MLSPCVVDVSWSRLRFSLLTNVCRQNLPRSFPDWHTPDSSSVIIPSRYDELHFTENIYLYIDKTSKLGETKTILWTFLSISFTNRAWKTMVIQFVMSLFSNVSIHCSTVQEVILTNDMCVGKVSYTKEYVRWSNRAHVSDGEINDSWSEPIISYSSPLVDRLLVTRVSANNASRNP